MCVCIYIYIHINISGYIDAIDALELAKVSCELGAGRTRAGESIDHTVGMELLAVHGQFVEKGGCSLPIIVTFVFFFYLFTV